MDQGSTSPHSQLNQLLLSFLQSNGNPSSQLISKISTLSSSFFPKRESNVETSLQHFSKLSHLLDHEKIVIQGTITALTLNISLQLVDAFLLLPHILSILQEARGKDDRVIVGIVGSPGTNSNDNFFLSLVYFEIGAGKSVFALLLSTILNLLREDPSFSLVLGLDAYHFSNAILESRHLMSKKGGVSALSLAYFF